MTLPRRLLLTAVLLGASGVHAQTAPDRPALVGPAWIAEDIAGGGAVERARATMVFDGQGRVSGSSGCNRYTGGYRLDGASLRFDRMAGTMMACERPALSDQERRFHAALAEVRSWRIESGMLALLDAAGATVLRFARSN